VLWLGLSMRALSSHLVCVGVDLHAKTLADDDMGFALTLGVYGSRPPCHGLA
jgi:hypothetical protein